MSEVLDHKVIDDGDAKDLARRLLALHEGSPLLVALFDDQDVLRYANPAYRQAYRAEPDGQLTWAQMMRDNHGHGHGHGQVIEVDDIEAWLAPLIALRGKLPYRAFEVDLGDGRWIWMTETGQQQGWILSVGSDITGLRQGSRSLHQAHSNALAAAQTDPLTGLSNRRHGMQLLRNALSHSENWPLCVATLSLDTVKALQDSHGQAAGDLVIRDFSRQLHASIRREDGCARMGGEAFVLILPAAGGSQAGAVLDRLLARVRRARPLAEDPQQGYRVSVGLVEAVWGETAVGVLQRADAALSRTQAAERKREDDGPPAFP